MPKQRLTDRQLISGVTLTDLLHFVVTGDTSQSPAGSSYKGNVEQLFDSFSAYTCTNPLTLDVVNACTTGITINGNVVINGSATTINTEVIQSKDNNIVLNYSGTHLTAIGGGITLEDGQSNGVDSRIYTDSNGTWLFDPGLSASTGTINDFTANTISVTTIGNSGDCVNDLYVSNIHSCSPLNINPLDEGNVYFGATSGLTIDVTNSRLGIGTTTPTEKLDVSGNTKISGSLNIGTILSGTPLINLGLDSSGNVVTGTTETGTSVGNVLYVSETGDDGTAQKGNLHKPWRNLYAAKSASTSGDTIYVLPQTIVYDNRDSAGNPYNGQVDTLVNLWKDGVTYYFSPNTKIEMYNQSDTGALMYLFNPGSSTGETCSALGYLVYEQFGVGPNTTNGVNCFYCVDDPNEGGSTFYAEVKDIISHHCETIRVTKTSTLTSNITIKSESEYWDYVSGNVSSGGFYYLASSGANSIKFNATSKRRDYLPSVGYSYFLAYDFGDDDFNVYGDELNLRVVLNLLFLINSGVFNINIKNIYYYDAVSAFNYDGVLASTFSATGGWTLNVNSNLYDSEPNSLTTGIFDVRSANNTINFNGNITTNTSSGIGRFIADINGTINNKININGDITALGSGVTTQSLFKADGTNNIINYSGKISGNLASGIANPKDGGVVNINNSYLESNIDGNSSSIFVNDTTDKGVGRLNNSYVRLTNNTNGVIDGEYNDIFINNSSVINLGSGTTIAYNTTNSGNLQITNSTLISSYSGATSIDYSGTTTVISTNSTVNTNYNINDLRGNINTLTDLTY